MFTQMDNVLLQFFQKISDCFQLWLGITNFFFAKLFLAISVISLVIERVCMWQLKQLSGIEIIVSLLCIVLAISLFLRISYAEWDWKSNPLFITSTAVGLVFHRKIIIVWMMILIVNILVTPMNVYKEEYGSLKMISHAAFPMAYFISLYFTCCTPKPPSKSKIKKIIEKTIEAISLAPKLTTA